ncbi:hypothetical protein CDCA_CDCA05G1476 [Cyanidium caldarium]|uniref:200 kDa antigen p200 n=1 Tax=Cyanidium caldarium TaxID=2771 RepID=A0AAV9ITR1_CYACA|nr:hypothetical protein CDCA_CDCA05G1476 [Cyanidium caldarium]
MSQSSGPATSQVQRKLLYSDEATREEASDSRETSAAAAGTLLSPPPSPTLSFLIQEHTQQERLRKQERSRATPVPRRTPTHEAERNGRRERRRRSITPNGQAALLQHSPGRPSTAVIPEKSHLLVGSPALHALVHDNHRGDGGAATATELAARDRHIAALTERCRQLEADREDDQKLVQLLDAYREKLDAAAAERRTLEEELTAERARAAKWHDKYVTWKQRASEWPPRLESEVRGLEARHRAAADEARTLVCKLEAEKRQLQDELQRSWDAQAQLQREAQTQQREAEERVAATVRQQCEQQHAAAVAELDAQFEAYRVEANRVMEAHGQRVRVLRQKLREANDVVARYQHQMAEEVERERTQMAAEGERERQRLQDALEEQVQLNEAAAEESRTWRQLVQQLQEELDAAEWSGRPQRKAPDGICGKERLDGECSSQRSPFAWGHGAPAHPAPFSLAR